MKQSYINSLLVFFCLTLGIVSIQAENLGKTEPLTITVQKGETLSSISKRYLADSSRWSELLKYNKIPKPDLIKPGLKLVVPVFLQKEILGVASFVLGLVEFNDNGGKGIWTAVKLGQNFHAYDQIRTSAKGKLDVQLTDLGSIRLLPNTLFEVSGKKATELPFSVSLLKGGLDAKVNKSPNIKKDYSLTIVNPSSTAGVRGTEFKVELDEKENSITSCYEGKVEVSAEGETVILTEGLATFVEKGKIPVQPFSIPGAPKLKTE